MKIRTPLPQQNFSQKNLRCSRKKVFSIKDKNVEFRPENLNGNLRQVLLITLIFLENHCQQTF